MICKFINREITISIVNIDMLPIIGSTVLFDNTYYVVDDIILNLDNISYEIYVKFIKIKL